MHSLSQGTGAKVAISGYDRRLSGGPSNFRANNTLLKLLALRGEER